MGATRRSIGLAPMKFLPLWLLLLTAALGVADDRLFFFDDFHTSGKLNGSEPAISSTGARWIALEGEARGSSDGTRLMLPTTQPQTAVVELGPGFFEANPGVWSLTLEFTMPEGNDPAWIGLGFAANPQLAGTLASTSSDSGLAGDGAPNGGSPWILFRQNGEVQVFLGPGAQKPLLSKQGGFNTASRHSLTLKVDTSRRPWTLQAFANGSALPLAGAGDDGLIEIPENPGSPGYAGFSIPGGNIGPIVLHAFRLERETK